MKISQTILYKKMNFLKNGYNKNIIINQKKNLNKLKIFLKNLLNDFWLIFKLFHLTLSRAQL
jgi:hypothetical protein